MLGLLLALAYFAGHVVFCGVEGGPRYLQESAWLLMFWWGFWGCAWVVIFGLITTGLGGTVAVMNRGEERLIGLGILGVGFLSSILLLVNYGMLVAAAYLVYDAAPAGVESWSQYDQTKCIIAGVLLFFCMIFRRFLNSASSKQSEN